MAKKKHNGRLINNYLNKKGWRLKENSNFSYSWSGLLSYVADNIMANYTLQNMPSECSAAHKNGDLHIHDLNSFWIPYCHGGDMIKLLTSGVRSASIRSKPAKHMDTAVDHMVNYIFMSQLEFAGAQALSDINTLLAPFVHYDNLNEKQVKQNLQRLVYNLNFESRQAFQTPFSNISFNLKTPNYFKNLPAIVGGKPNDRTYTDFQEESDMILRVFCDILLEKDNSNRPFTFPIPTLNLTKDIDWNSSTMDKVCEVAGTLGSFYFMNYISTGISEDTVRAMCCRLMLDLDELPGASGLWNFSGGTGSIGVVSLNMSRLGYLAKSEDALFEKLDELLGVTKKYLMFKDKHIRKSLENGLLPFSSYYDIDLDRYFRTVGIIGLNEMCENFLKLPILNDEAVKFSMKVLNYIREWTRKTQSKTQKLWNLEETPGEGSSYRLALIDSKRYKNIYTMGNNEAPYYTCLIVPPMYDVPNAKLKIEEKILPIFTGGTVFRNFMGEMYKPIEGARRTIQWISEHNILYFDLTATFGVCVECDVFSNGAHTVCPKCGGEVDTYSRVVGYYRPSKKYNVGKLKEFKDRTYVDQDRLIG